MMNCSHTTNLGNRCGYLLIIALFCVFSLLPTRQSSAETNTGYRRPVEVRAVWIDRRSIPKSEREIRMMVRRYADAGFNLLLPEVIYNGYTAYPSRVLPMQNLWNGLDILKIIVDEAHRNKIEVHPWVWVFRAGHPADKGGILTAHPDWAAVDKDGDATGYVGSYWLCPSIPGARELLLDAYKELVTRYKIDGIHLDYVRFDDQSKVSTCFNKSCRDQFIEKYGINPCMIEPFTKPVIDWHLWREDLINSFVRQVSDELRMIRPNLKISAAVGNPYNTARIDLLQNWMNWVDNRWVDFLIPMGYTANDASFRRRIYLDLTSAGNRTLIIPGIGVHLLRNDDQAVAQIEIAGYLAASGSALFSSSYIKDNLLDQLRRDAPPVRALLPFRDPTSKADRMLASAVARIRPTMKTDDLVYTILDLMSANSLLQYAGQMKSEAGYILPTVPEIFIPEVLQRIPEAIAVKIDKPIIIDGQVDEQWQKIVPLTISATAVGEPVSTQTQVRIAYDESNLYICMTVDKPLPEVRKPTAFRHDDPVFRDDSFEVFIDSSGKGRDYLHFAANTSGVQFEQKVLDAKWDGDWNCAVTRDNDVWCAEFAMSFKALGANPPFGGDIWRMNFCRNIYSDASVENSCWSAVYGSYHTPSRFGRIRF